MQTIAQRLASKLRVMSKSDSDKLLEISVLELQANTKEDFINLENKIKIFKSGFSLSEEEWLSNDKFDERILEKETSDSSMVDSTTIYRKGEVLDNDFDVLEANLEDSLNKLNNLKELIYKSVNKLKEFPISPNSNVSNTCGEPEYGPTDTIGKLGTKFQWLDSIICDYQLISNHLVKIIGE
jgi:hypothetical protein